ncbi:MAG: peptidoglycan DD-metalloendopeptidase family protein [Candidatus Spyradocola sp.]
MLSKFRAFWSRYGYACVLTACVLMVALTAYFTRRPQPEAVAPEVTRYALVTPSPRAASAAVTPAPTQTPPRFLLPCDGKPGMLFAQDTLTYSRTLGEYATHGGTDFLGKEGDVVRAIGDGVVTAVSEDPLLGHCIEITHRDGYISTYASLATAGLVQPDESVSRGQIIGTMGVSAASECAEGPHLHLELRRLRKPLDPMDYLTDAPD